MKHWMIWTPYSRFQPTKTYDTKEEAIRAAKDAATRETGLRYFVMEAVCTLIRETTNHDLHQEEL